MFFSLSLVIYHSYIKVCSWKTLCSQKTLCSCKMQTTFKWRWFLQDPFHSCLCSGYDSDVHNRSKILLHLQRTHQTKLSFRPASEPSPVLSCASSGYIAVFGTGTFPFSGLMYEEIITESQDGWGWNGPLKVTCSNLPAHAATAGCPDSFWICPRNTLGNLRLIILRVKKWGVLCSDLI